MTAKINHDQYIKIAIQQAKTAYSHGNFPQGCCLVHKQSMISSSRDLRVSNRNPLDYAEMILLKDCVEYINDFGTECYMYSVFEPDYAMLPLLVSSGLKSFYFGLYQPKYSPSEFIDNIEYFRKMLHYYNSGYREREICSLFPEFSTG